MGGRINFMMFLLVTALLLDFNVHFVKTRTLFPENNLLVNSIIDAYGSPTPPSHSNVQQAGSPPAGNSILVDAIIDAYGSNQVRATPAVAQHVRQNNLPSAENPLLVNAIIDTYGANQVRPSSPAVTQKASTSVNQDPMLIDAIIDAYGSDIKPAASNKVTVSQDSGKPKYVPQVEEMKTWREKITNKRKEFFSKYGSQGSSGSSVTTQIDHSYYTTGASFSSDKYKPNKKFFHVDHNVTKTDIGSLDFKLARDPNDKDLDYKILRSTPHGRHLLLITLLEDIFNPMWIPRFKGKIAYYLPEALKPVGQPETPSHGVIKLNNIVSHGRVVDREEMLTRFRGRMPSVFRLDEDISRFNLTHGEAVGSLLEIILGQETFDSTLSLLVFIHSYIHPRTFSDVVMNVVDVREDVGFVLPMMQTINPYDYFQILSFKNLTKSKESEYNGLSRSKRQTWEITGFGGNMVNSGTGFGNNMVNTGTGFGNNMMTMNGAANLPGRGQVWRISWNEGVFRTLPESDPESQLWYFREDPLVSAHHLHWHLKMSNRQVPVWHPSNGLNMDRRGEMFYFMHKQMLCRYNADRIALGMPLTTPFLPEEWGRPISPGYNPRLTESSGRMYPPRPDGAVIPNINDMMLAYTTVRQSIREGTLRMVSGPQRLGYAHGVDFGISALGDALEAFVPSPILGNLHNDGHQQIGLMHAATMGNEGNTGLGVMGNPNGAVRDPLFFRWHKIIDDIHQEYKNTLPQYGDEELDFPGVEITSAHVQSERGTGTNNLYTYMDTTTVRLQSVDLQATDGSSVNIAYDRLNHIPFTYHININSRVETQGILRLFLIPAGLRLPSHTDITQVAIEMDRFLIFLNPGSNYFNRHSSRSPFVSKSALPLIELQERLLMGQISEEQFNWSGCGWPESMVLPRGREGGMRFRLYIMVSQLLPDDSALTANWERMQFTSWSWCGVRRNEGDVPDSRPMGFPLDRAPTGGNWQSLMFKNNVKRGNHFAVDVTIRHDPIGTTSRNNRNQMRG